jgi:signal transduction histidine kinase
MTHTQSNPLAPSATLLKHKAEIEEIWAQSVRKQIQSASQLADPILYNYFPDLLQRIAEALEPNAKRFDAVEGNTSAHEHGGERARLTNFNISQIATEFYLLKEAIHSVLETKIQLTHREWAIIDRSIDQSLQESITSFALAESYIREQFIAMLAHDIRGPIAFIKMATSLLMEGVEPSVASDLFQRISDAAENAGSLIDNILDASVIKASRRIKLGIEHINMLDTIQTVLRQYPQHNIQLDAESVVGYWCPRGLKRVIQNLVDNALKYGDTSQPIIVKIWQSHGAAKISVHNEGNPIPVEEQENVFQPFHRSHASIGEDIKGWGFGLPIVRGLTEAHGGSIEVESTVDLGTTITITMPLDARPYQNTPVLG